MKISELIEALKEIHSKDGDLECVTNDYLYSIVPIKIAVEHKKILTKRESKEKIWGLYDGEDAKGEKICLI